MTTAIIFKLRTSSRPFKIYVSLLFLYCNDLIAKLQMSPDFHSESSKRLSMQFLMQKVRFTTIFFEIDASLIISAFAMIMTFELILIQFHLEKS
jgi:hypothetical protein